MVVYRRSSVSHWELKSCAGEPHSTRAHSHGEWSLGLITGGACRIGCAGAVREVSAPALVWFSPETVHECRPRQTADWAFQMLYWPEAGEPGLWGVQPLSVDESALWVEAFARLEAEASVPLFPWAGTTAPGLRRFDDTASTVRPDRRYKRLHGLAPTQHGTILRLRRAQALLRQGTGPAEAALEAGFYDQAQFTRAFRAFTGTTPGRYARS